MRVDVIGTGRAGLSIASLLVQRGEVGVFEVVGGRLEAIGCEELLSRFLGMGGVLGEEAARFASAMNAGAHDEDPAYVVIAPRCDERCDGRPDRGVLCARCIDEAVAAMEPAGLLDAVTMVVAAPVSPGCTDSLCRARSEARFLFCSDFACERDGIRGGLQPSHVVLGVPDDSRFASELQGEAKRFANLLIGEEVRGSTRFSVMRAVEAESARLFADKYVAMQDSFLKGVCAFSDDMGLDADSIIAGLGLGSGTGPCMGERSSRGLSKE